MRIKKIEITNINSFRKEQSVEMPNGVVGIVGLNGAGKTTLVEAIMGSLYGRMPFRKGMVINRVNKREQRAEMGLEFEYRKNNYRVVRKITPKTQKAFLYVKTGDEWQSLVSKGSPKDFAVKIDELIGPYETMLSSVFCAQNNANDLLSVDASERKRIFRDLLGIRGLERKSEACGKLKLQAEGNLKEAEFEYLKIKDEIGKKDSVIEQVRNSNDALAKLETEIRAKQKILETLQVKKGEIAALLNRGDEVKNDYENAIRRVNSVESEIKILSKKVENIDKSLEKRPEMEKKAQKYLELEKKYGEILGQEKKRNDLRVQITSAKAVLRDEKSQIEHDLASLMERKKYKERETSVLKQIDCERAECPFIKDALAAKKELPVIEKKMAVIEDKIKSFKKTTPEIEDMETRLSSMKVGDSAEIESQIAEYREAYQGMAQLKGVEERRVECVESLKKNKESLKLAKDDSIKLSKKLAEIQESLRDDNIDEELETAKIKIDTIVDEKNECQKQAGYLEGQLSNIKRLEKGAPEIKDRVEGYRSDFSDYAILETAYGKNGIQALLIDKAIPEFNGYANNMLQVVADGKWKISFQTQKSIKSSENLRETLDIMLLGENGIMDINECSGGERQLLSIIIRAAIGIYNSVSSGRQIKFFVLDEPFKFLDPPSQLKMIQLLGFLKKYFKQVFITSNLSDIVSDLPSLIEIKKEIDGSKIRRIR